MGILEGCRGQWGYPEGGMGAVSQSIASAAASKGATILTNQVSSLISHSDVRGCIITKIKTRHVLKL